MGYDFVVVIIIIIATREKSLLLTINHLIVQNIIF